MDSKIEQQLIQEQKIGGYRLLNVIGRGGFADVYLAEHTYLQTRVALKVFRSRPGDEQMVRFLAQIRKLAQLQHAHILPILSCDVQDGSPFLVMPYAPGGTLRQRHPRGSQVAVDTVLTYLRQIAPALDAAHRAGQIHGDIKPENLLLGENDELLLGDFGLAPVIENEPGIPQALITGTVTYMAPEQLSGRPEPASDQYALAILISEWLRGEPPFTGTYTEVAAQHALIDPPSLRQERPDLPPQLEQVLLHALAKNPYERFATVQMFASALEQATRAPVRMNQPLKRGISRRALLWGTIAIGGASAIGGSLAWKRLTDSAQNIAPLYTYHGHIDRVYGLSWSPDSTRLVSVDLSGSAQVWQAVAEDKTTRGKLLASRASSPPRTLDGIGEIASLAWSPQSDFISLGDSSGEILVWESVSKQNRFELRDYASLGACVAWSPGGENRLAAAYVDDRGVLIVAFWDIVSGNRRDDLQLTSKFTTLSSAIFTPAPLLLAWSPNGKRLALSNGYHATQIWDMPGGRSYTILPIGPKDLAWSPDSKYLATDNQVWDVETGKQQHTYAAHSNTVAWSPDGKYLATGGADKTISLWEVGSGKLVRTYQGHTAPINVVRWSPDGLLIASASDDHTVRIW